MFRKKALGYERKCSVLLQIPGEKLEITYSDNSTGQHIFDDVAKELNLSDKDYFGLRFHDQLHWLDLTKPLIKQIKDSNNIVFDLRFKFYPAEPALLANESTRYYLYLQLKSDLIDGRLKSDSQATLAYLIACILQAELGDSIKDNNENYVVEFKFVPNQTEELELAAIDSHRGDDFRGLEPVEAELNFLNKASHLVTYGIDPCPVKDGTQNHFLIGVNHRGIATFQDTNFISQISWDEIDRITLDGKLVLVYCCKRDADGEKIGKSKALFGFKCPTKNLAQYFWKIANEHRFFFTLESTPESPIVTEAGGFFKKTHKLKYGTRVERDLLKDQSLDDSQSSEIRRSCSLISKSNHDSWLPEFNLSAQSQDSQLSSGMTSRSHIDYFKNEKWQNEGADQVDDINSNLNSRQELSQITKKRNSICSISKNPAKNFVRRSTLITKADTQSHLSKQSTSNISKKDDDFIKTTLLMILIISILLMIMFFINESKNSASINLVVEQFNLDHFQLAIKQNYYMPLKSRLINLFSRVFNS